MKRVSRRVCASGFVLAACMTLAGTEPVSAQGISYELVSRNSGKCLDVTDWSTANGAPMQQWTCHGGANQQWMLRTADAGVSVIVSVYSGKALDVTDWSPADGAPIQQWDPTGGSNQQWTLQPTLAGIHHRLADSAARHSTSPTGRRLTVPHSAVGTATAATTNNGCCNRLAARPRHDCRRRPPPRTGDVGSDARARAARPSRRVPVIPQRAVQTRRAASYPTLPLYPTTRDTTACPNGFACQRDNYTMYPVQNRFFVNALYGSDQLRQRVAFALHQILVVSGVDITQPSWMTPYLQTLDRDVFGNFRQLLYDITLNAAMGNYLDMNGNTKTRPNENYAREVLQLFSIGTVRLNVDGTPQLDASGQPIPTYDQTMVTTSPESSPGGDSQPASRASPITSIR